MDDFATYILNELDPIRKINIILYKMRVEREKWDSKEITEEEYRRDEIFFNKSIVLREEIGRMFLNYANLDVDKNEVITELLLCNCKKVDDVQKLEKLKTYAKEGADYLSTLGFSKKFCHACEGLNRYIPSEPREKESDILELVDQFCGLILSRPEREGFKPEEALVILKERNLKDVENRYLENFIMFVEEMEKVCIKDNVDVPVIRKLAFLAEKESDVKAFVSDLSMRYSEEIDGAIAEYMKKKAEEVLYDNDKNDKNNNGGNGQDGGSQDKQPKKNDDGKKIGEVREKTRKAAIAVHRYTGRIIRRNNSREPKFIPEADQIPMFDKKATARVLGNKALSKMGDQER